MKGCVESKILVHSEAHKSLHCSFIQEECEKVSRVPLVVQGTR